MTVTPQQIEDKLRAAIQVDHLVRIPATGLILRKLNADMQEIIDTSGNCGGAYNVVIVSPDFQKKMTLARHKMGACAYRAYSLASSACETRTADDP